MTDTPNLPALRTQHDLVNPVTDSWAEMLPQVAELARAICTTDFVPAALRNNVAATTAAILYNREIGLPPMTGLNAVHVIKGKVGISAEVMRAQVFAAGHEMWVEETNSSYCKISGRRADSERVTSVTYSENDAKVAGLMSNDNYRKNPRRMYQARATSELCALMFPDVIRGMASSEELYDEEGSGDPEGVPSDPGTVVQRKTRRKPSPAALEPAQAPPLPETGSAGAPGPVVSPEPSGTGPVAAPRSDESPPAPPLPGPASTQGPPSDEGQPPDSEPVPPIEDRPASKAKLRAYHAAFKVLGYGDSDPERAARLAVTRLFADAPNLATSNDLTDQQASAVLTTLARFRNQAEIIDYCEALTAGGEWRAVGVDEPSERYRNHLHVCPVTAGASEKECRCEDIEISPEWTA